METLGDINQQKISKSQKLKFCCKICDYTTSKKFNYESHVMSSKHKRITDDYIKRQKSGEIQQNFSQQQEGYSCSCGKQYQHRQNLWRHKKQCIYKETLDITENKNKTSLIDKDDLILELLKQNKELLEIVKNGTNNTTIHTNSHNKAFNLNFFLNETCKNAMNITDFVDSIKLQLNDLMEVGELGYVEGISKIIVKNLNNLDETLRPIHCTDKKRETMYIKDADKWEKEDDNKTKLKKAVKKIADKNIRLLPQFREKYPDYGDYYSKTSDIYEKIVIEAMVSDNDKDEKIIKKISNATVIQKI